MQASDLNFLFAYNAWADQRILAAAANLTQEQFLAPTTLSWGSVRDVLVHSPRRSGSGGCAAPRASHPSASWRQPTSPRWRP